MTGDALELVAPHCDIRERLRALPPSAKIRGIAFRSIRALLEQAGKLEAYCQRFGALQYESLAFYPLSDYLVRLASAGALLHSPEQVYLGIGEISRANARQYSSSLLGQALLHALASDPLSLLEQGLAMRRQTHDYGRWELVHHAPRDVEVLYRDEYIWIEASHHEAAVGTFESCNVKPIITTQLTGPYAGSTRFRW